jgi:hypothetical protein
LIALGLGLAAIWIRLGVPVARRAGESTALALAAIGVIAAGTTTTRSWDFSESRANSFPLADERALRAIDAPISIEAHLAPEDPRRVDLERHVLGKLRRVRPDVQVRYVSATSIGLFEQTSSGYGEIRYDVGGRKATGRSVTAEAVLETLYSVAGVTPPAPDDDAEFRGHPLVTRAPAAAAVFYLLWPALVISAAIVVRG